MSRKKLQLKKVYGIDIESDYSGEKMLLTIIGEGTRGAEYEIEVPLGAFFIGYIARALHKVLDAQERFTRDLRSRMRGES